MASRKRSYTSSEVVRLLNNTDSDLESDSELDSSLDSSEGSDKAEAEVSSDSDSDATIICDVVDDVTWSSSPVSKMQRLCFTGNTGLQITLQDPDDPLEYFKSFMTTEILDTVALETNRRAAQLQAKPGLKAFSRIRQWVDMTMEELKSFIALLLYMGVIWKPELKLYWTTKPMFETPYVRRLMTEKRFSLLMKCLHFVNSDVLAPAASKAEKSLNKIRPFFDALIQRFSSVYTPSANVAVDESLMLWKGRLAMKQYIPLKRARFGLKSYELCESGSGYIWNSIIHTGPTMALEQSSDGLKSSMIVLTLGKKLLDQGYCFYMDNWYSSPALFRQLRQRNTDGVGTVRVCRSKMPADLKQKLPRGNIAARFGENLMALKWHDKREITMLSTYHGSETTTVKTRCGDKEKPVVIVDYNKNMGAVDVADQMLQAYQVERKRKKVWYKKQFQHLLNRTVLNCYILYKKNNPASKMTHLEFVVKLIARLIEQYGSEAPQTRKGRPSQDVVVDPMRLTGRHFAKYIPATDKKQCPTRQCKVCCSRTGEGGKKVRKETRYYCETCDVGLCLSPCFEDYHVKVKY